jgi:hypothetical protein
MSGYISAEPVWAGIAIRLADGTLWAVELDQKITASIDVQVEEIETTDPFRDTFRSFKGGDMHVKVTINGIGRTVSRFGSDMGADHRTGEIEAAQHEIEG